MGQCLSRHESDVYLSIQMGDDKRAMQVVKAHPKFVSKRSMPMSRTVWHVAAEAGKLDVLEALADLVWSTMPDEDGNIHARRGPPGMMHPTIRQAINQPDMQGCSALALACHSGHGEIVAFLMMQGADPWARANPVGKCPLHFAAAKNHADSLNIILCHPGVKLDGERANGKPVRLVDLPTGAGYSPMHYAVAGNAMDAVNTLLMHGANCNAKTWSEGLEWFQAPRGSTPLHMSARMGLLDMAVIILKHFHEHDNKDNMTDPRVVQNDDGQTPWQVPGARSNAALSRVLNPATPLRDVVDPFGETVQPKLQPLAPLPDKFVDHARAVLNLDADAGAGQPQEGAEHQTIEVSAAAGGAPARGPGNFSVPSLPLYAMGSGKGAAFNDVAIPKGWEDVLSGGSSPSPATPPQLTMSPSMGTSSGKGPGSQFVSIYRNSELGASEPPSPRRRHLVQQMSRRVLQAQSSMDRPPATSAGQQQSSPGEAADWGSLAESPSAVTTGGNTQSRVQATPAPCGVTNGGHPIAPTATSGSVSSLGTPTHDNERMYSPGCQLIKANSMAAAAAALATPTADRTSQQSSQQHASRQLSHEGSASKPLDEMDGVELTKMLLKTMSKKVFGERRDDWTKPVVKQDFIPASATPLLPALSQSTSDRYPLRPAPLVIPSAPMAWGNGPVQFVSPAAQRATPGGGRPVAALSPGSQQQGRAGMTATLISPSLNNARAAAAAAVSTPKNGSLASSGMTPARSLRASQSGARRDLSTSGWGDAPVANGILTGHGVQPPHHSRAASLGAMGSASMNKPTSHDDADEDYLFNRDSSAPGMPYVAPTFFPFKPTPVERVQAGETFNCISQSGTDRPVAAGAGAEGSAAHRAEAAGGPMQASHSYQHSSEAYYRQAALVVDAPDMGDLRHYGQRA